MILFSSSLSPSYLGVDGVGGDVDGGVVEEVVPGPLPGSCGQLPVSTCDGSRSARIPSEIIWNILLNKS